MSDTEAIKRTLNRKGPNCDDFKDGLIRDLKTHVEALLADNTAQLAQTNELVARMLMIQTSLPYPEYFHRAFGWDALDPQFEQYRNEIHHLIAVELPDMIQKALPPDLLERQKRREVVIEAAKQLYRIWKKRTDETIRLTLHPDHPGEIILPDQQTQQYIEDLKTEQWQATETLFEHLKEMET